MGWSEESGGGAILCLFSSGGNGNKIQFWIIKTSSFLFTLSLSLSLSLTLSLYLVPERSLWCIQLTKTDNYTQCALTRSRLNYFFMTKYFLFVQSKSKDSLQTFDWLKDVPTLSIPQWTKKLVSGSGRGSVGRAVASNTGGPRFEFSHWSSFYTDH